MANSWAFVYFHVSIVLKIDSISQTPLNFKQRTSLETVCSSGNEAASLVRILLLFGSGRLLFVFWWVACGHASLHVYELFPALLLMSNTYKLVSVGLTVMYILADCFEHSGHH